jgi:hypothetical protein
MIVMTFTLLFSPQEMARKLIGGALGAISIAAGAVRHVAWYVNHQLGGQPREKQD